MFIYQRVNIFNPTYEWIRYGLSKVRNIVVMAVAMHQVITGSARFF